MHFITLNTKEMNSPAYTSLKLPHLLISITDPNRVVKIPKTLHCKQRLDLNFLDIEKITDDSFNMGMAEEILNFINMYCHQVDLIVVHSENGQSRSVAVGSALSKILNHKDDGVFSHGISNMLVYVTILDAYFMEKPLKWSKIDYLRNESVKRNVKGDVFKVYCYKQQKKKES